MNVCGRHSDDPNVDEINCCECSKCKRTLVALDAVGILNEYSRVFNLDKYYKNKKKILWRLAVDYDKDAFSKDNYDFCKNRGIELPTIKLIKFLKGIKNIFHFCFQL